MVTEILSFEEMREKEIATDEYRLNLEEGSFNAVLEFLAEGKKGTLRAFFRFDDGRKVFAQLQYFNNYLGILKIPHNTPICICYEKSARGIFPMHIELI